jgi:hypothetical protein
MTILLTKDVGLTLEQMRFADAHNATSSGLCADDHAVCLYREQPKETVRWTIDRRARVLERTEFRVGC